MAKTTTQVRYFAVGVLALGLASAGLVSDASAQQSRKGPGPADNLGGYTTGEGGLMDSNCDRDPSACGLDYRPMRPVPQETGSYRPEGAGN